MSRQDYSGRRGYNIDSLTVGETENPEVSRNDNSGYTGVMSFYVL